MGAVMEWLNTVVSVVGAISLPVKIAWGVWLVWGAAQLAWYYWPHQEERIYRTTTPPPAARPASGSRITTVRSRSKVVTPAAVSPYGTSDFLAALDEEQQQATVAAPADPAPITPDAVAASASAPYQYPLDVSKL